MLVAFETPATLPPLFQNKKCPKCGNTYRLYHRPTHQYFCATCPSEHQFVWQALESLREHEWLEHAWTSEIADLRAQAATLPDITQAVDKLITHQIQIQKELTHLRHSLNALMPSMTK